MRGKLVLKKLEKVNEDENINEDDQASPPPSSSSSPSSSSLSEKMVKNGTDKVMAEKSDNHCKNTLQTLNESDENDNYNLNIDHHHHHHQSNHPHNDLTRKGNQTTRVRSKSVDDVKSAQMLTKSSCNHICCCKINTITNTTTTSLPVTATTTVMSKQATNPESILVSAKQNYSKYKPPEYAKSSTRIGRKTSTVNWGPIYTVPVFAQNYSKNIEENNSSIMPSNGAKNCLQLTDKISDGNGLVDGGGAGGPGGGGGGGGDDDDDDEDHHHKERRSSSSVGHILFGSPYSRRFSQDLFNLKLPDEDTEESDSETTKVIFFQVFIPFLIAGFGNVGAGLILDYVQNWQVFKNVNGLFVLVASFLGFKGNLEMTLAARLSTQANLGQMDLFREQIKIATGNIALIQCQAIVVAFLAAIIAICSASIKIMSFDFNKSIILLSTSLITASITGLFLGSVMVIVVIISRKTNVNPDNVSTLIAAFLGDITAVIIIALSSVFFYTFNSYWISGCVIAFFILILPVFSLIARKNEYTHEVVGTGWLPIILAMIISSLGGFIFDYAVDKFRSIALFQPIVNGVGSNLVAVQASRISTYFHQRTNLGEFPVTFDGSKFRVCEGPHKAFLGSNPNAKTARLLLLMVIPGHIIYIVVLKLLMPKLIWITTPFLLSYILVAMIQVAILLYVAHITVPLLWKLKFDPDNNAIPCLMSLGDLTGTAFFTFAYVIMALLGDPNARMS